MLLISSRLGPVACKAGYLAKVCQNLYGVSSIRFFALNKQGSIISIWLISWCLGMVGIFIPRILPACLGRLTFKTSPSIRNKYGAKGQPWHIPLMIGKHLDGAPLSPTTAVAPSTRRRVVNNRPAKPHYFHCLKEEGPSNSIIHFCVI
jgi:hypothetical protein